MSQLTAAPCCPVPPPQLSLRSRAMGGFRRGAATGTQVPGWYRYKVALLKSRWSPTA